MSFRLYAVFGVLFAALFVTERAAASCSCFCSDDGVKTTVCTTPREASMGIDACADSTLVCAAAPPVAVVPPPAQPLPSAPPPEGAANCRTMRFGVLGTRQVCSVEERHDARREQWAAKRAAHEARWAAKQAKRAERHAHHTHDPERAARKKARWDKRVARWNARRDKREARWAAKEHKWASKDS